MSKLEFWIGDRVRIISSGKEGIYEGTSKDGRARVKWKNKILLTRIQNLDAITEKKPRKVLLNSTVSSSGFKRPRDFNPTIDLHIEVLNPSLTNEAPQIILNHQILRCREHIEQAIALSLNTMYIIHGKGTGQLKREVDHLISMNDNIRFSIPQHDGGATEVWLK